MSQQNDDKHLKCKYTLSAIADDMYIVCGVVGMFRRPEQYLSCDWLYISVRI